jgi:hypothetical protein
MNSKSASGTDDERETLWEESEGRTLDNPRFPVFWDSKKGFDRRVVGLVL